MLFYILDHFIKRSVQTSNRRLENFEACGIKGKERFNCFARVVVNTKKCSN